jgi:hypothetical protein
MIWLRDAVTNPFLHALIVTAAMISFVAWLDLGP